MSFSLARSGLSGHMASYCEAQFLMAGPISRTSDKYATEPLRARCSGLTIEPVIATHQTEDILPGRVLGLHQIALVQAGDEVRVVLDLTMAVGVPEPADTIDIDGDPPVRLKVSGGFHGDRATVGCVVNAIPFIVDAPPGLHKVVTLPLFGLFPEAGS